MSGSGEEARTRGEDERLLESLGYSQELRRRMSAFSNFAISLSIICILAGGITSFHLGFSGAGGAAIGIGWPVSCLLSLVVALTMAQVASAFPTAGGLYHWAAILGGKGAGWATAWLNLLGLVAVTAAINVGTWLFAAGALGPALGFELADLSPEAAAVAQALAVAAITLSQAVFNHLGIRLTTRLTDFSGWLILGVAAVLTALLLAGAESLDVSRLWTFTNFSGPAGGDVWPRTGSVAWIFLLGFLLPAYTITGFDASAHTSEETVGAARSVPRGIVRSVAVSGLFGWLMLAAVVLAMPDPEAAAATGSGAIFVAVEAAVPRGAALALYAGIAVAQYLCGLAAVTSASRMAWAFARDGGTPASGWLRAVDPRHGTPARAVWAVSVTVILMTLATPVYATLTAACTIFLYISYVLPTVFGLFAHGRTWTAMGPFDLGRWYRPLAVLSVLFCGLLIAIGMAPPNDRNVAVTGGTLVVLAIAWFARERRRFRGPPLPRV